MDGIRPSHEVTARKPHCRSWCGKEIRPGERYAAPTPEVDHVYEWRECGRCKSHVDEMSGDEAWGWDDGNGIQAETFQESMRDRHQDVWHEWQGEDDDASEVRDRADG